MTDTFKYIAFFDLDQTLTSAVSGRLLAEKAVERKLMSRKDIILALWYSAAYRLSLADPVTIVNKMASWVKGLEEKILQELAEELTAQHLMPSVFPAAVQELEKHSAKKAKTVILSSAPSQICSRMARNLGMNDYVCSELEVRDGILTGLPSRPLCFGEEKAVRMKEYCSSMQFELKESWYYGDSIADFHALSIAGHPVCINPDKRLFKAARKKNWTILNWKN
jgi:putative phosphoserine phosphatase/1-acylglycerol-3-phosphate O-acyltransferase